MKPDDGRDEAVDRLIGYIVAFLVTVYSMMILAGFLATRH